MNFLLSSHGWKKSENTATTVQEHYFHMELTQHRSGISNLAGISHLFVKLACHHFLLSTVSGCWKEKELLFWRRTAITQQTGCLPNLVQAQASNLIFTWTFCWLNHSLGHLQLWTVRRANENQNRQLTKTKWFIILKQKLNLIVPFPYDAIVRDEDISLWATAEISCALMLSISSKKKSTELLRNDEISISTRVFITILASTEHISKLRTSLKGKVSV